MMIKVSIKINEVLKRLKTIKFRMMIKNRNKIGLPFEVVINGKKLRNEFPRTVRRLPTVCVC